MTVSGRLVNTLVAIALVTSVSAVMGTRVAAAPARATTSITFISWSSTPVELAAVRKLISNFESKHKTIKVDYTNIANNYDTTMKAKLVAGTQPDVFWMNSTSAPDFIRTGQLKNLDFLKKVKGYNYSAFYKPLAAGYVYKGHIYGVPKDYSTLAVFYNKTMLSAAGIKKVPTTWTAFANAACKLTNKANKVYGTATAPDIARWMPFVFAAGGSYLNKNQNKVTINSSAAKKALDWYTGMAKKGCAAMPSTVGAGWNGQAFGEGHVAMAFEGNWLSQVMHDTYPSVSYGIAPLPKGPKGFGNYAFTSAWVISNKTKHLKEASQFLEYVSGKTGMNVWQHESLYIGSRKDVKPLAGTQVFVSQVKHSQTFFFPPGFNTATDQVGKDIQAVIEGKMSSSQALQDMASKANIALNAP